MAFHLKSQVKSSSGLLVNDLSYSLENVLEYNKLKKVLNLPDTIEIIYGRTCQFIIDEVKVQEGTDSNYEKHGISLDRLGPQFEYIFRSTEKLNDDRYLQISIVQLSESDERKVVYAEYYKDQLEGRYAEFSESGQAIVEGEFKQIDSVWTSAIEQINPETYERETIVNHMDKKSIKTGIWKEFDSNGEIVKSIKFDE